MQPGVVEAEVSAGRLEDSLFFEVHDHDLQNKLQSPQGSFALSQWVVARGDAAMPDRDRFMNAHLEWLKPDAMVLVPDEAGALVYRHYGSRIVEQAGFDMTGRRVGDFRGSLRRFFQSVYDDVLARPRPVVSVHRLGHFRERPMWERVILPLASDGAVAALYVVNMVRDIDREFNAFKARNQMNGLIALQFVRDADGGIIDAVIVGANRLARDMTGRRLDELLDRPVRECFPGVTAAGLWERYLDVAATRRPQSFVLDYGHDRLQGRFDVLLAPFQDGVSIDFARLGP